MPKKIVTAESLGLLLSILHNWQGELTWELYCNSVTSKLGLNAPVTKQALMRYESIRKAFSERKEFLRGLKSTNESTDHTIEALQLQVANLAEQVRRLSAENSAYKEKFVRWLHNIYMFMPQVDISKLDSPMTSKYKNGKR